MVNAMLVAEEMGIVVEGVRSTEAESFSNLITLTVETPTGARSVAGTLFEGTPKIVKMRNFVTDFTPEEHMLVITYADRPGLIGRIGTILGEEGLNIGNMNLGRRAKAGEAMVVLSIDSPIEQHVIDRLTAAIEPLFIKAVHLTRA
jgi:D-3-phosphoglycerate dehydrogenase